METIKSSVVVRDWEQVERGRKECVDGVQISGELNYSVKYCNNEYVSLYSC
jgi:hypothetical protein